MYFVYIINSETTGRYYIGQTENIELRLKRHNSGQSRYTKNKGTWKLVYSKEYETRSEAVKEESRLKKMKSRKYIEFLINSCD